MCFHHASSKGIWPNNIKQLFRCCSLSISDWIDFIFGFGRRMNLWTRLGTVLPCKTWFGFTDWVVSSKCHTYSRFLGFGWLARQIPLVGCFRPVDGVQEGHVTCQFPTVAIVRRPVGLAVGRQLAAGTWFFFSHIVAISIPTDWYFSQGLKPPTKNLFCKFQPRRHWKWWLVRGTWGSPVIVVFLCVFLVSF